MSLSSPISHLSQYTTATHTPSGLWLWGQGKLTTERRAKAECLGWRGVCHSPWQLMGTEMLMATAPHSLHGLFGSSASCCCSQGMRCRLRGVGSWSRGKDFPSGYRDPRTNEHYCKWGRVGTNTSATQLSNSECSAGFLWGLVWLFFSRNWQNLATMHCVKKVTFWL